MGGSSAQFCTVGHLHSCEHSWNINRRSRVSRSLRWTRGTRPVNAAVATIFPSPTDPTNPPSAVVVVGMKPTRIPTLPSTFGNAAGLPVIQPNAAVGFQPTDPQSYRLSAGSRLQSILCRGESLEVPNNPEFCHCVPPYTIYIEHPERQDDPYRPAHLKVRRRNKR